jgi:hypothetical protein
MVTLDFMKRSYFYKLEIHVLINLLWPTRNQ